MDPRRRAELLATLSPEGRATYEVLRAQLARDLDRCFAESKARLEKGVEAALGDLRRKSGRVPSRDDDERAKEIVAATTTAPALSTPAASHVFPDAKHGPDLAFSTSSTTHSTRPLCVSSSGITTDGSHESEVAASSTNPAPAAAAAATGISVSSATSAAAPSCGVASLVASASNCSTSPGGDSGAAPDTIPPVSTGPIGVPASTMQSKADHVFETPVTCSTLGLYAVGNTIHANKVPLPNLVVSPSRFAAYSTSTCMAAVSVSDDSKLALAMPTMCSTKCPREDNEATRATSTPTGVLLASSASVVPATCAVHSEISSMATASMASMVVILTSPPIMWTLVCDSPDGGIAGYVVPPRCGTVLRNLSSAPILAAPASCSIDLTIVPSTASSTCLPMGHNLDTSSLVLAIAPVLDIIDTTMAEQQDNSEKDSFAQKMDTYSLWHAVSEFSASQSHRFIRCESLQTAATLVSVSPFQCHEKCVWPPSFSLDVVALHLQLSLYASFELSQSPRPPDQLYGQNNKYNLVGMNGCFLFTQSSTSRDMIHVLHILSLAPNFHSIQFSLPQGHYCSCKLKSERDTIAWSVNGECSETGFSPNVLILNLHVYEQKRRCRSLEMSGSFLFEQSNISKDIIHVHTAVDGGFELLHGKMAWSFNWGCSKNGSLGSNHCQRHRQLRFLLEISWLFIKVFSIVTRWPQSNGEKPYKLYRFLHCLVLLLFRRECGIMYTTHGVQNFPEHEKGRNRTLWIQFSVQLPWIASNAMVVNPRCSMHYSFAWFFSKAILQSDCEFGTLGTDFVYVPGIISFDLTIACTRYAWTKELHHEPPVDHPGGTEFCSTGLSPWVYCSTISFDLLRFSSSAKIYSQHFVETRSLCRELFAIGMYQLFVHVFGETVHQFPLLGWTSMMALIRQNGGVSCFFRATGREDGFPYIGAAIDQAMRLCLLTDLEMRSPCNSFHDHEQIQWKVAWLFSLVGSAVDGKPHGFASPEAMKRNSVPSGSEHLQWEIACFFTPKTSVLLCEDCPAEYASGGDLHVIMLDAAVKFKSVAPWAQPWPPWELSLWILTLPTEDVLCTDGLGSNCNCCLLKKICIAKGNSLFLLVLHPWDPGNLASITTGVWTVQVRLHSRTGRYFGVCLADQQPPQRTWDSGEKVLDSVQCAVQAPWDPGVSTGRRLEGKPKLMEGGLSATLIWAGPIQLNLAQKVDGLRLQKAHECPQKQRLGTDWRLRPRLSG